jgi:hypothetical protein
MVTKTNTSIDPNTDVDVPQTRSKMPVETYPIFPMGLIIFVAAVIIGVALVQLYFGGSFPEGRLIP